MGYFGFFSSFVVAYIMNMKTTQTCNYFFSLSSENAKHPVLVLGEKICNLRRELQIDSNRSV